MWRGRPQCPPAACALRTPPTTRSTIISLSSALRAYAVGHRAAPAAQAQDEHQIDLAQPGDFQQLVARRARRLGARDAGIREFLDGKPARGGDEVRSEEVNRACGTVRSLGRRPPARPQIPKTSATVSSAPAAD